MLRTLLRFFFYSIWPRIPGHTKIMLRVSRRFTAGETADDALALGKKLNDEGFFCDFNYIGDHSDSPAAIEKAYEAYVYLIRKIKALGLHAGISPKFSQFGLLGDTPPTPGQLASFNLLIANMAATFGVRLWIDREEIRHTKRTNQLIKKLAECVPVGTVAQAYNRRAVEDLVQLGSGNGISWRVCKGAYAESSQPIVKRTRELRNIYLSLVSLIVASRMYVQLATHDQKLLQYALACMERWDIPKDRFEIGMLYGIDMKQARALLASGYRVTIYVPFGVDIEGYCIRRIIEKPKYLLLPIKAFFRNGSSPIQKDPCDFGKHYDKKS